LKKLIFIVTLLGFQNFYAQDYSQFWLRTSFHHKLSSKLSSSIELHHRTESLHNTESPFRYPLTNACRLWIVYKLSDHETINFSPYAFFSNHPQIRKEQDVLNSNVNEHRVHLQYENKLRTGKAWSLDSRLGAEYRIFEKNHDLFRIRFREVLSYSITEKINIQIYDELFLNTINIERSHVFDQNRIGFQLSYTLDRNVRLDLGHNLIHALPRNAKLVQTNFMFFTTFNYTI